MSKAAASAHVCHTAFVALAAKIRDFVDSQTAYLFKSRSPPRPYNQCKTKNPRCNPIDIFNHVKTIATYHIIHHFTSYVLVINVRLATSYC